LRRPSPGLTVALIALLVALSQTAIAAPVKTLIGGKQIKRNAVTSKHVKDGSLLVADFKAGLLPAGPKGDKGDAGPQGVAGPQGTQGNPGVAGVPGFTAYGAAFKTATTAGNGVDNVSLLRTAGGSGGLVLTESSQVFAWASMELVGLVGNTLTDGSGSCQLFTAPADNLADRDPISSLRSLAVGPGESDSVALVGTGTLPPGTYDVFARCSSGTIGFRGDLAVIAYPTG
jgi:hypothetical protein